MDAQLQEKCQELGKILGLDKAVAQEVLLAALEDKVYAHNLLVCRKEPLFLNHLLSNPPKPKTVESTVTEKNNLELIGEATKALVRWGKTGFSSVGKETLERRENACLQCPNLVEPKKNLQKLVPSKIGSRLGKKTCSLCGCSASWKIRLPSESCPDRHPTLAGMTRWKEPVKNASPISY